MKLHATAFESANDLATIRRRLEAELDAASLVVKVLATSQLYVGAFMIIYLSTSRFVSQRKQSFSCDSEYGELFNRRHHTDTFGASSGGQGLVDQACDVHALL